MNLEVVYLDVKGGGLWAQPVSKTQLYDLVGDLEQVT